MKMGASKSFLFHGKTVKKTFPNVIPFYLFLLRRRHWHFAAPRCEQGSANEHNWCTSGLPSGIGGFLRATFPGKRRETAVCPQASFGINPAQSWINFYLKKKGHKLVFHCHIWRLFRLQILGRASWLGTKATLI